MLRTTHHPAGHGSRTPDGWQFTERVYEIRYLDTTPLAGSAPHAGGNARTFLTKTGLDLETSIIEDRSSRHCPYDPLGALSAA